MKFRLMSRVVSIFHVGMIAVTGQSVSTPSGSHCANSDASGTKISCRRRSVHCHSHKYQWQWKGWEACWFQEMFWSFTKAKQLRQKLKTLQPFNVGVGDMTKFFFSWYETFYLMITIYITICYLISVIKYKKKRSKLQTLGQIQYNKQNKKIQQITFFRYNRLM